MQPLTPQRCGYKYCTATYTQCPRLCRTLLDVAARLSRGDGGLPSPSHRSPQTSIASQQRHRKKKKKRDNKREGYREIDNDEAQQACVAVHSDVLRSVMHSEGGERLAKKKRWQWRRALSELHGSVDHHTACLSIVMRVIKHYKKEGEKLKGHIKNALLWWRSTCVFFSSVTRSRII